MMGTVHWPDRRRIPKRQRKFVLHDVPHAQAEDRWKCATCDSVIASDADVYCRSCKIYWQDAAQGLLNEEDY